MKQVYIIAEAGQNHNGSISMAKQLIDMVNMPIMDTLHNNELPKINAIKFTKRDLTEELTKEAAAQPYNSPHSFGKTYGEHREKLELSYEQHIELFHYAKDRGLDFVETLTSPKTLQLLNHIDLAFIKIASRDLTNLQLLEEVGKSRNKVILSSGMGGLKEIDNAVNVINKYHDNIVILHCISQYPAEYQNLNLNSIPFMKEYYKGFTIGYSDHSIGIIAPVVAVALGAEFIEKHITLSHSLKGSDQAGSLEPDGLWRMTRDIRNMELAFGSHKKELNESVAPFRTKLERSLCSNKQIKAGTKLNEEDLIMLSPGGGMTWLDKEKIMGKTAKQDIDENTTLEEAYFI